MRGILKDKIVLGERDTLYVIKCPDLKEKVRPGQFFEIRVRDGLEPFLRRPISIFDSCGDEISFLVRTVGQGTRMMTEWERGKEIDLLGPLGNGFQIFDEKKNILLAGGGIGAAPLYLLAKELLSREKSVTLLFSPKRDREILRVFQPITDQIQVVYSENRTEFPVILEKLIQSKNAELLYICGPMKMMETAVKIASEYQVASQVSLEAKMGCGLGICMGCAVPIKNGENDFVYKRVCQEGPVFDGEEVIF